MQKKETASSQQSIERALKLLMIMGEIRTPMNITEISRALGISRSTTYAMVHVMTELNFLAKNPDTGKYFLGYSLFTLGSISRLRYSHMLVCDDYLRDFVQQISTPLTRIGLYVMEQDYKILTFLRKSPSSPSGNNIVNYNRTIPAFCTASGKVLLSELSESELETALSQQEIRSYTPSTITDLDVLREQLPMIRKQGYCVDIEEYSNFEVNIAAPLRDQVGKTVAVINVTVSPMLYRNRTEEYIQLAQGLAKEMSSLLGYRETLTW